jgi:hypothetical protein
MKKLLDADDVIFHIGTFLQPNHAKHIQLILLGSTHDMIQIDDMFPIPPITFINLHYIYQIAYWIKKRYQELPRENSLFKSFLRSLVYQEFGISYSDKKDIFHIPHPEFTHIFGISYSDKKDIFHIPHPEFTHIYDIISRNDFDTFRFIIKHVSRKPTASCFRTYLKSFMMHGNIEACRYILTMQKNIQKKIQENMQYFTDKVILPEYFADRVILPIACSTPHIHLVKYLFEEHYAWIKKSEQLDDGVLIYCLNQAIQGGNLEIVQYVYSYCPPLCQLFKATIWKEALQFPNILKWLYECVGCRWTSKCIQKNGYSLFVMQNIPKESLQFLYDHMDK